MKVDPSKHIIVKGAKIHNLQNIDVVIPKNKLSVVTGISGSGKSSLAFDTVFAEGQRRYVESLSSYARQFLNVMEKPEVDSISGLTPAIAINQKTVSHNPRSTVGTVTEIYDYLRLLFARIGKAHCPQCSAPITAQNKYDIVEAISKQTKIGDRLVIMAILVQSRKGQFSNIFAKMKEKGFVRVRVDGVIYSLDESISLNKNKKHNIELVVDRLKVKTKKDSDYTKRLSDALELALDLGQGDTIVRINNKDHFFSENNTCLNCNLSFPKLEPALFSFNSPRGACAKCEGLGFIDNIDINKLYNPNLTVLEGGILPDFNQVNSESWYTRILREASKKYDIPLQVPIGQMPKEKLDILLYGTGDTLKIEYRDKYGNSRMIPYKFEGTIKRILRQYKETSSDYIRSKISQYLVQEECPDCFGSGLNSFALSVKVGKESIHDHTSKPIEVLYKDLKQLKLYKEDKIVGNKILKEICTRLEFLINVGLEYITLSRRANTLSGGESQRIRLASQLGTGLSGCLYVLDEPSIGLHPADIEKLIKSLISLRDLGNTVLVVEHDFAMMRAADYIIEIGPKAGYRGGRVIFQGPFSQYKNYSKSISYKYLQNEKLIEGNIKINGQKDLTLDKPYIEIKGVSHHNLKTVNAKFPLKTLSVVTGVSGSGKSSLVIDTLYPALFNGLNMSSKPVGKYVEIANQELVNKVVHINQSPIGTTPRSVPATYIDIFTDIRKIFANTKEAKARGFSQGHFSFNMKTGQCPKCRGKGLISIEMLFMPNLEITCPVCQSGRYKSEILDVDYKGKNIAEVLNMEASEAVNFFKNYRSIVRKLKLMNQVGLGYLKLGQSSTTLSGGESQRIKLAKELAKIPKGNTIYILDEPTIGLHSYDIELFLKVIKQLLEKGSTIIIVEHNLDIIKQAEWIVDLGPKGGLKGGKILYQGSIQGIRDVKSSQTAKYL